jgi:hypothetical protein
MAETTKASSASTGEGNAVRRTANKWSQDVEGIKNMTQGGGFIYPGMSMPDIQGSQFDNPGVFDEYKKYVNEEVNEAEHLKDRFDERQIDWDLTDRKDLGDDGKSSEGVKQREQRSFTRTQKSDQDR